MKYFDVDFSVVLIELKNRVFNGVKKIGVF
jgi:hypothetical protein